jgi:hypothetical protein
MARDRTDERSVMSKEMTTGTHWEVVEALPLTRCDPEDLVDRIVE